MLHTSLESLKGGMILGKGIYREDGRLLLGRGVALNSFYIRRLRQIGISSIYIRDESTDDVIPLENISEAVRGSTLHHMKELFGPLDDLGKEMKAVSVTAIKEAVSSEQFQNTFRNHPALQKIREDAALIVEQLLAGEVVIGINSLKTYDNYTFQHSIDVTIVSIMIGRKIGLSSRRLRELGIGCILHDLGKTFVPKEIVNKPGKLTPEEFERMKAHTTIGFELVRGAETVGVLPPHVVLQHHEKQNGTGYPRGLTGNNRLDISEEPRTIHLYGSIAAVADIYDALSSDRPYRKAFPPEKVIDILCGMSGDELNREIMRNFLAITPVYPVGSTVRVIRGRHLHYTGVVVRLCAERLDWPVVRLLFNGAMKRIEPVEIDLLSEEGTEIVSVIL
jgi:HD-GYP domain-containing protein (c-di-GMP phosphodiesterase class II)